MTFEIFLNFYLTIMRSEKVEDAIGYMYKLSS